MMRQSRPWLSRCAHGHRQVPSRIRRPPSAAKSAAAAATAEADGGAFADASSAAASSSSSPSLDDLPPAWAAAARRAHVAVVLVEPQICENIGAAARAMRNFGIRPDGPPGSGNGSPHLRLVSPRDGCPPPQLASDVACGGSDLVASAGCYGSLEAALADRHVVYAATARARRQAPRALGSRELARDFARRCAAAEAQQQQEQGAASAGEPCRVALVFGRESSGLTNAEVGRAHAVVEVDAAPEYPVLNLGAAVCALSYELWRARRPLPPSWGAAREEQDEGEEGRGVAVGGSSGGSSGSSGSISSDSISGGGGNNNPVAEAGQVDSLLARLYAALDKRGFFTETSKRPSVERSLGALLRRVEGLGERDLALLHGAITALSSSSSSSPPPPQQRQQR